MVMRHQFGLPRNKYGVSAKGRRTRNGPYGEVLFASLKEARYYDDLILRQTAGEVVFFLMQVPFKLPGTKYVCDFQVFEESGIVRHVDVKGLRTATYLTKKKAVKQIYGIDIEEV